MRYTKNDNICSHCKANMREQWLKLNLEQGLPITEIAKLSGVHQDTLYIWKRNYLEKGIKGLINKSRAPHSHPNEYSDDIKKKIKYWILVQSGAEHKFLLSKIMQMWLIILVAPRK